MAAASKYIVDVFMSLQDGVQSRFGSSVNFMYGHPVEIVGQLQQMTGIYEAEKWPLVALFQDFEEKKGDSLSIESSVNLNIIIAQMTLPTLTSPERYEQTFKPVLYPLYEAFINQVALSGQFSEREPGLIKNVKIDHVYWGKKGLYGSSANTFNDYIDAIEIKDLQLKLLTINCNKNVIFD